MVLFSGDASAQGLARIIEGNPPGDVLGFDLAGPGDVDGDGIADVLISVPGRVSNTLGRGGAQVRSGADDSVIHDVWGPDDTWFFGRSVGAGFDIDGDGRSEFMVADEIPSHVQGYDGLVRVYSGLDGSIVYDLPIPQPRSAFGFAMGGAGDVNNDGVDDFFVSARDANRPVGTTTLSRAGAVYVYSGADGALLGTAWGPASSSSFGQDVVAIGDYDGDGHDDLAVSTDTLNSQVLFFVSGADFSYLETFVSQANDYAPGWSIAALGDVDGDGVVDIAIGDPSSEPNGVERAGAVRVRSGADGSTIHRIEGWQAFGYFGREVAALTDVDGDGVADFAVGADRDDTLIVEAGAVYVYSGATGAPLATLYGRAGGDLFGRSIADLGDLSGDGRADLAIAAPYHSTPGVTPGRVYLFTSLCDEPTRYCDALQNSSGSPGRMDIEGDRSIHSGSATLHATQCPPGTFGVFFYGFSTDNQLFGAGRLCVGLGTLGIYRLGPPLQVDAAGHAQLPLDFGAAPLSTGWGRIDPGATARFQFWFRDTGGFNLTDALAASFCH